MKCVAIVEQIKKRIRKKDEKLVPADIVQPIFTEIGVTLEWVSVAF